jgi:hypothetical protein
MVKKRFYKATAEGVVYFRSTATREYCSIILERSTRTGKIVGASFRTNPNGDAPTVEITEHEFDGLRARALAKLVEQNPKFQARWMGPSDSKLPVEEAAL